jgi:undecaprenyl-diphosphatase
MDLFEAVDQGTAHYMVNLHRPWLTPVMIALTRLGDRPVLLAVVVAGLVGLLLTRRARQAAWFAGFCALAVLLTEGGKRLVDRPRFNARWAPIATPESGSFPSAHALEAMVAYIGLGLVLGAGRTRKWLVALGCGLVFLIGVSRLYLGMNYLSDVLAGWAAGAILVRLLSLATHPPDTTQRE